MNVKGVIFDFDGTIVKSTINFKKIKEEILKEAKKNNLKIPDKNLPILELLEGVKRQNRKFYFLGHRILKQLEIKASEKTEPQKGVVELLKRLKKEGIKVGIITRNCRDAVESVIRKFNIPYDVLLTRDDVKKVKPDSFHITECLKLMGLSKKDVFLVGDHIFDVRAGKKTGIVSIGLKNDYISENDFLKEGADLVIEDIEEVEYITGTKGFKTGKIPNRFLRYLLTRYTSGKDDKNILISPGVGIDCAIFKVSDKVIFAKADPITLTSRDIGFYLVNINVNDISVMGGIPLYLLTALLFPEGTTFCDIEYVFSQISNECKRFGIKWIGGHTEIVSGIKTPVSVGFLTGEKIKRLKKRRIRAGDKIFLVKEIGIEGVSIIAREKYYELKKNFSVRYIERVKNSVISPGISVFNEAKMLWENFDIKYIHDPTEGGISTALYEMSEANNIGLLIYPEKLRFYPPVVKFCKIFNLDPMGIISSGCIIGIVGEKEENELLTFCKRERIKIEIIGKVIDRKGVWYIKNGTIYQLPTFTRDEINRL
ncbi:MAG: HAD-IA family hydrolase [Candidatus Omnitrophica bacterium]|nr:HAD-IA family hydrolase [Candidatus Omnitrophota bacterium]